MMGRPSTSAEQGGRCRRHPRHRQATGVCPYCLRECLSRLPHHHHYSSTAAYLRSSSVSSSLCSSDDDDDAEVSSSEDSSPIHSHSPESTARVSFPFRREICVVASGLTRSQSLVFFEADGRKEGEEEEEEKGKKKEKSEKTRKKEKVWWKLMSGSRRWWNNKKESRGVSNLMHSQTFKEKPSAKWVLFV
ncbi:uncharacterized protein LOC122035377 [Zingiber officinale]|uniref:uncharacterized protein LOC122035377 n=1 Tax=Zingiber officinale TaxID=94328 RepID=UPI001C4AFCD4|nr:uncharacterized protein LOC122035377 [Zingiber officinale]